MAKIFGTGAPDILHGTNAQDEIWGFASNDRLYGEAGDDVLVGGTGADYLHGGAGFDTASYSTSSAGVVVSLIANSAANGDAQGDTFTSIESLIGSYHADTLSGHNGVNVIDGGSGNDTLEGHGADDTLRGEDGNDILDGGSGYHDILIGGLGNDTYVVDSPYDRTTEFAGQGIDVVRTSAGFYALTPGADIEILETTDANATAGIGLHGNSSSNQIIGNNGPNGLYGGGGGVDEMIGRGGDDTYAVYQASDRVIENGGQGNDTVNAHVSYTLTAGADVEVLQAGYLFDTTPIDLTGNASGNVVRGNAGNNTLNGGDGRDDLFGRDGQDSFLFDTPLNAASNVDRIRDFDVPDDTILLDDAVFSGSLGLGNISAGEFVIGTAAQDANDRIIYDSNTGTLLYDSDGAGGTAAIQFAEVSTGLALTNLDFLVV
jgi:Ca2+-binding RTX toxin-like protein